MICKKCGAPLKDGDVFCQKCGTKVEPAENSITSEELPTVIDDQKITISRPPMNEMELENESLKKIWPDWKITEKLGEGSFGKVYRAERNEMGNIFESAIKIITIPQNSSEAETIKAEIGLDEQSTTSYFRALVDDCVNEIKMMESFKGTQNIVSVEDYKVVAHTEEIGWTIYIRMELLTSFISFYKNKTLSEQEVLKLGIDICSALEYCAKLNVMHRDIKPENIFISKFGEFKLGDFGIARKLEKSTSGMSKKGTYNYMAPEIYCGSGQYDYKSDIYSLGIVLYKLLNNNRFPLIDPRSTSVTYNQMQDAFDKRMSGAALPKPLNASDALASVILAACSFNPNSRFATATAMKMALLSVQSGNAVNLPAAPVRPAVNTAPAKPAANTAPAKTEKPKKTEKPEKPKKTEKPEKKKMSKGKKALIWMIVILILLAGLAGTGAYFYFNSPEHRMLKAIESGDFTQAIEIYKEDMDGEASKMLLNEFGKLLDQIELDYISETIDYASADEKLSAIEKMGIEDAEFKARVEQIREYIDVVNESRAAFEKAEELNKKGDYEGAIEYYKKVAPEDANYETAKANLAAAINSYRDGVLEEAEEYFAEKSYAKAIEVIEEGLEVLPDDDVLSEQLKKYQKGSLKATKDEALEAAKKYADEEDYPSAIKTLNTALSTCPDDKDITSAIDDYTEKYVEYIVKEADELIKAKDFEAALELLDEALTVLPDDETLTEKKKEVSDSKPVSLSTIKALNGGWEWNEGDPTDPFGETYNDVCNFVIFNDRESASASTVYAEYRLYRKYGTITGKLVPHQDIRESGNAQMKIYADDELVYTSEMIGRKTDAFSFEASVKGADYIKIELCYDNDTVEPNIGNTLILMDVQLWGK